MIICTNCGHQNEDGDTFCGSCATFLEWAGERVAEPDPEPGPQPDPVPEESERPGLVSRVKSGLGLERTDAPAEVPSRSRSAASPAAAPEADQGTAAAPAVADQPTIADEQAAVADAIEEAPSDPDTLTADEGEAARRAAALLATPPPSTPEPTAPSGPESPTSVVGDGTPAPSESSVPTAHHPAAHQPAVAQRHRSTPHAPAAPSRTVKPGDLICSRCGEGNKPERRFCRRCGNSLVEAVVVKTPWWRKLLRRRKRELKAGERPDRRGGRAARATSGAVRKGAIAAVVVALVLVALPKLGPARNPVNKWVVTQTNALRKKLRPRFEPVRPTAAVASSEDAAHPAALAIDGKSNTYWSVASQAPAEGSGQFLLVSFDQPITLSRIGFTIGAVSKPEDFLTQPRPAGVHIVLVDAKGAQVGSKDLTLSDNPKFQAFRLSGRDVSKVQVQITSVNRSAEGGHQASIAEVEFFKTA